MGFPLLHKLGSPAPSLQYWAESLKGLGWLEARRTPQDTKLHIQRWGLPRSHHQLGALGRVKLMEVGESGGVSMETEQHGLRSLGQTCSSMNTGYQWDQRQEWGGQEVTL